jgi:mgtE-like transporter
VSHVGISKNFIALFKETSLAYFFDIAGLIAGFFIAYQLGVFQLSPWALALYPALISTKVISGLLSGRLSTALHLGTVYPQFTKNTKSFYKLVDAVIVLTLATSLSVSLISLGIGSLFWGITVVDFSSILIVMVSTLAIGLFFSLLTLKVAFVSFKRGLDPDILVYPIMSTVVTIFMTLCYIGVLNLYFLNRIGQFPLLVVCLFHAFLAIYLLVKDRRETDFRRTLKESLAMMVFFSFMITITGTFFRSISDFVADRREIYIIYPALINLVGDVGSVVGSTATTKLALGLLTPSFSSLKNHAKNIFSAWVSSFLVFTLLGLISLAINHVTVFSSVVDFLLIVWIANIISIVAIVLLSFGVAILTFKRGLDPDNFVIPVETSLVTLVTTIALLIALLLMV